jgi:MFS family permease
MTVVAVQGAAGEIQAQGEWREGWPVILSAGVGFAVAMMHFAIVSALMKPMAEAYGWSRTEVTLGLTITTLIWPVLGLGVGHLADRFGARRVALVGISGEMAALAIVGLAGPQIWTWWAAWTLFPFMACCASPVVWTLAVASRFDRHRALALAAGLSLVGVGVAVVPLLTTLAYDRVGIRAAFWVMAGGGLALALPIVWACFYDARDLARVRGKSLQGPTAQPRSPTSPLTGLDLREAAATFRFWRLGLALLLVSSSVGAMSVHLLPLLNDGGLSRTQAALVAGLSGPFGIVGRLTTGYLLDRRHAPTIAAVAFALPIVTCLLLLDFRGSLPIALVAAAVAGLAAGAEMDVVAYLTSRYFGMRRYGAIYACMFGLYTLGVGLAPVLGGWVFDSFGSYDPLLIGLICGLAVSAFFAASLGRFPIFAVSP